MKIRRLLLPLFVTSLCVGCGQNTTLINESSNQINTSTSKNNHLTSTYDTVDTPIHTEDYVTFLPDDFNSPENYDILWFPIDENNVVPVGKYASKDYKLHANVEYPNEINTQNLDIVLANQDFKTTIDLTDTEGFWKICINSTGYYPIQTVVEDIHIGQGAYGLIKRIPANRVTTFYNTVPWPKGTYQVQITDGLGKAFASIQTGSSLDELGISIKKS